MTADAVAFGLAGAGLVVGWLRLPSAWRAEAPDERLRSLILFGPPGLRRAARRAYPSGLATLTMAYLSVLLDTAGSPNVSGGALAWVLVILVLLGIGTTVGVHLFNRPRLVVPPAYRGEPGLFHRRTRHDG